MTQPSAPAAASSAVPSSPVPERMRASVLMRAGVIELQERAVPSPGTGQVLLRVLAVGTCGSDVHYFHEGRIGDFVVEKPMVLGHEPSGEVVAVGPGVTRVEPGQRVSIEPGTPCFACPQCLAGRYNLCPDMRFYATPPIDGAFSEYVLAHQVMCHPVPDHVSDEAAALLEPLSVGPIGLVAVQTARAFGASQVVVSDVNPHRLALAAQLGATATVDVSTSDLAAGIAGLSPDVLIECSGVPSVISAAIRCVDRAGRVVLVGMGGDEIALPLARVQNYELTVTGTFRYANTWPIARALVADGSVDLDALVSHRFGLAEVVDALDVARTDPTAVKAVVLPQQ
jgi:L-iditol 2-dehydrogenase